MNNQRSKRYAKIVNLLSQNIGLNPDSLGYNSIVSIINQRLQFHGLGDENSYLKLLQSSTQELSALVESVVVPETSFFRNRESFNFLQNYVQQKCLLTKKQDFLRILSIPCSTGEEPYSIAITLIEAGLQREQFQIDAVDISHQALDKARRGLYRYYSFGKQAIPERRQYFHQTDRGYQLHNFIRSCVNFRSGNLLDDGFLREEKPYDLIFCRNLLIYLHPSAQLKAMEVINRLLVEQGLLFVGYADTRQVDTKLFSAMDYPLAFAYQKQSSVNQNQQPHQPTNQLKTLGEIRFLDREAAAQRADRVREQGTGNREKQQELMETLWGKYFDKRSNPSSQTPNSNKYRRASSDSQELKKCRHLANWGQLPAAAKLCEAYLRRHPLDPQAYLLRGEIYQATGQDQQAQTYFGKAIYLDPDCYQALVYLALFKEDQGDHTGAKLIRQRIERLTDIKLVP